MKSTTIMEKPTCPDGICINDKTGHVYMFGDECYPDHFEKADCDQCSEKIECQFTKYVEIELNNLL